MPHPTPGTRARSGRDGGEASAPIKHLLLLGSVHHEVPGGKLGAGWGQAEGKHPLYDLPSWDLQPALHSSFLPAQ